MQSDHVLVFDIGGEYGHFRKFNTTTSPLTYSIPPRTALLGIIGAILGIERETGIGKFKTGQIPLADLLSPDKAGIAVQILNPVNKVTMAFNLLNTKSKTSFFNIESRTQIEFELLKNPKFRIFLTWDDSKMFVDLEEKLKKRHTSFTVSLGLSQFIAEISFVGSFNVTKVPDSNFYVPVISAIKMSSLDESNPIQFNSEFKYVSDTLPVFMTSNRLVKEYSEVIIETSGQPILAKGDHIFEVESLGNIQFL